MLTQGHNCSISIHSPPSPLASLCAVCMSSQARVPLLCNPFPLALPDALQFILPYLNHL